jgi:hypothetical protein
MTDESVSTFQGTLRGPLIRPSGAEYDSMRALYNGMIDRRPYLIARCVDVADVIAAVNFGREQGLFVAIRGGGHNGPGLGSCDDGLGHRPVVDEERSRRFVDRDGSSRRRMHVGRCRPCHARISAWSSRLALSRRPASRASRLVAEPAI